MNEWIDGNIIKIMYWSNYLFSIIINAPINKFIPGQYAKIFININGKKIQRAYSYVNDPNNNNIEFYLVKVKSGKLSSYLSLLKPGDKLKINKNSFGYFTLEKVLNCKYLWMIATGTAIGPYLSILQNNSKKINSFEKIILVYAVRFYKDLNYFNLIKKLQIKYKNKLIFQPIISREKISKSLMGRIPDLIKNQTLEKSIGLEINKENSHVMICGNPSMVKETQKILINTKGMIKNSEKKLGHITTENYW